MALPPTASKFSSDVNNVTTFFFDFPNFTGSHSGVTASLGINSVAGGGTGLASLTLNNVILGNGTSSPTFVAPGTSGNVLSSNGTTWLSTTPVGNSVFVEYSSSLINTNSSPISTTYPAFSTFSNSPGFSVTPTVSGTYKIYASIPLASLTGSTSAMARIFNTSGGATLLNESQGITSGGAGSGGTVTSTYAESVYSLTAGNTYVFDIQGSQGAGGSATILGADASFYVFADGVGLGAGTFTTVGAIDAFSPVANGLQIISNVLYAQSATTSFPGMVNTTTQSFAGTKTFTSNPTFSAMSTAGVLLNDASGNITSSAGPLPIANGGTDNSTLPVTAGGVFYSDGTKFQNVGAGTSGQILQSNGASAPTWVPNSGGTSPTNSYAASYFINGNNWSVSSTGAYADFTFNSGTPTLTSRVSNNITLTAAASNLPGITFTPASSSAVYEITCSFAIVSPAGGDDLLQLTDGTNVISQISSNGNPTGDDYTFMSGIYAPGTASPVTVKLQGGQALASTTTISTNAADTLSPTIQFTVLRIQ